MRSSRPRSSLKIDLHVHTVYSDGSGTVREVLEAARRRGLEGLAITDHDTLDGYLEAESYADGLLLLPGYEVCTDAGHVLVIGLEKLPPRIGTVCYERLTEWVRRRSGLTVLAHPATERVRLDRFMRCRPDAVEVLNALYPFKRYFVSRGLWIASKLSLPAVGGSDSHSPHTVGDSYTMVKALRSLDVRSVVESIKSGDVEYGGGLSPPWTRLRTGLGYLISKVVR